MLVAPAAGWAIACLSDGEDVTSEDWVAWVEAEGDGLSAATAIVATDESRNTARNLAKIMAASSRQGL
jgi:hypothetical protein